MTFRSLLVPLDGSTFAEHALPLALSIARRAAARLELVYVHAPLTIPDLPLPVLETEDREARQQACDYLDATINRLAAVSSVPVTRSLRLGPAATRLCEFVAEEGIDLVVMATHGRGPLSRIWLGSVANELVRRMPAPLLLVRPEEGAPDLASEPVLRRILLPLDGSPFAEQVLEPAAALGTLMQSDYRLVRVVAPVLVGGFDTRRQRQTGEGLPFAERMESEAAAYLKGVAERLQGPVITTQMRVITAWPPAVAILEDAQTHDVDLIALATHGRSDLARLCLGSVADKVLRGASVPVLLRRPVER